MQNDPAACPDISDDDAYQAMKEIEGYLDITPGDFRVLYGVAYKHAVSRLARSVKARDVMTRDVVKADEDTALMEVARTMAQRGISGLPIVDKEKRVVGVISEKDFVFHAGGGEELRSFMEVVAYCLTTQGCVSLPEGRQNAADRMTHPPVTVVEETALSEVVNLMAEKNINRVPVTDHEGKLLGIIARADIVQTTSCTVVFPLKS